MLARAIPRPCAGGRHDAAPGTRRAWVPGGVALGGHRAAGVKLVVAAAAGERRTAAGPEPVATAAAADGRQLANGSSAVAGTCSKSMIRQVDSVPFFLHQLFLFLAEMSAQFKPFFVFIEVLYTSNIIF
jgi:hypothetical protein